MASGYAKHNPKLKAHKKKMEAKKANASKEPNRSNPAMLKKIKKTNVGKSFTGAYGGKKEE